MTRRRFWLVPDDVLPDEPARLRAETGGERARRHLATQLHYGNYVPERPRTYRAQRRNALRQRELIGRASSHKISPLDTINTDLIEEMSI